MKKIIFTTIVAMLLSATANASILFYQEGFTNNLYSYDTDTATETLVGDLGLSADSLGLAFGLGGELYAFDRGSQSLYSINTNTAASTLIGNAGISAEDFTVSADGTQGFATSEGSLYSIDLVTGVSALIGATGANNMDGLTTSASAVTIGGTLFGAGSVFGVDGDSLFSVDVLSGAMSFLGSTGISSEALSFDSAGTLFSHGNNGFLYAIDLATFAATQIGATTPQIVFGLAAQQNSVTTVGEPATLAFIALGLGAMVGSRRRKNTRT